MKELLEQLSKGETTVDAVLSAIDAADKEKVPRSRLNDKIDEIKELNNQLKDRDNQLTNLKATAGDNESLKNEIQRLENLNKTAADDYQAKLSQQTFDFTLEKALSEAKAKNPKAVKALLNSETIKLDGDKLLGLDEQLKALQESDGYLFGESETPKLAGRTPQPAGTGGAKTITKEQFDQMSYTDRVNIYNENPDLYQKLNQ